MPIKVKKSGAYADPVAVKIKLSGAYQAVQGIFCKVAGVYQSVYSSGGPPVTINAAWADISNAFAGYYTNAGATYRFARNKGVLCLAIKGTSADMFCSAGDTTPFKILVDNDAFSTAFTAPTLAAGKIPLFSGLSDAVHKVFIWSDNSDGGQGFPSSGNLITATGVSASITPIGTIYNVADPSFPGVYTGPRVANAAYQPAIQMPSANIGWGQRNTGSIHCKAKFTDLYLMSHHRFAYISVNGGAMTKYTLQASATDAGGPNLNMKRVAGLTGSLSSYTELIISGMGISNGDIGTNNEILGVMLSGSGAVMSAPTATKRHCLMFGASQVEGIGNATYGTTATVDGHFVQPYVPIYTLTSGLSGGTLASAHAAFPAFAAALPYKDIIVLSIGSNSLDDGAFQASYQTLINDALTAGFSKVICRGILYADGSQAGRNTKIQAAVTAVGDARVVYASIATWTASLDGAGGSVAMPDNAHPSEAGYYLMADWWARDHSALFA